MLFTKGIRNRKFFFNNFLSVRREKLVGKRQLAGDRTFRFTIVGVDWGTSARK